MSKIVIVVPTYNERANIELLIPKIFETLKDCHLLIVDDSSPDGTAEFVKNLNQPNLHLLSRKGKLGLGSAYIDGFRWAMGNIDPDIIVQMDADFSHDIAVIPRMVKFVEDGYDCVVGSRYVKDGRIEGWPPHRHMISKGANMLVKIMLNLKVKDTTSGFKAWSKRAIDNILSSNLSSKAFEYQIESLLVTSKAKMRMIELPFTFVERKVGESKLSSKDIISFFISVIGMAMHQK
jgi:dolichol-phosphate mannosyltransferase